MLAIAGLLSPLCAVLPTAVGSNVPVKASIAKTTRMLLIAAIFALVCCSWA